MCDYLSILCWFCIFEYSIFSLYFWALYICILTTQVIIRHGVKILFSVISSSITLERQKSKSSILVSPCPSVCPSVCRQILCRMITWVVFLRMFWNFISSLPVKRNIHLEKKIADLKTGIKHFFKNIYRSQTDSRWYFVI
jgi:hypothetical protein